MLIRDYFYLFEKWFPEEPLILGSGLDHLVYRVTDIQSWRECEAQNLILKSWISGTSLVIQWLRLVLPMQGIWVRSLVRDLGPTSGNKTLHAATEDSTGHN